MKTKIIWSVFWVLVVVSISWCAYAVTPYIFGDKPLQAAEESTAEESTAEESTAEEETSTEEVAKPKLEEQLSDFINRYHSRMNDLTGWGRIDSPSWEGVHGTSINIVKDLDALNYTGNADLEKDLEDIRKLASELSEVNDTQKLRELHEYFHDIDVVMNGNYGEGDFFGITKWATANK